MSPARPQKILKTRRDYNRWVANEMMEDYALRYAPKSFRKWSEFRVANTALGAVSFLVLEAIGGTLMLNYGFGNTFWAILVVSLIVFLTGLPISYYAARYHVDMDLLTRGAGFGYIGSTVTSLIYASFTFIFFALEAAIMALALELYFGMPLGLGYLVSSLAIIPLVTHGITWISRLQMWTQPIWLGLTALPLVAILIREPELLAGWTEFGGRNDNGPGFSLLAFGAATTVAFSLIAQIGEQADFLRFLPDPQPHRRRQWWLAVLVAGPGWIIPGSIKLFIGAFLAYVAVEYGIPYEKATEPTQMYFAGFTYLSDHADVAAALTTLLVVICQVKINVTNAYAGSLAWSNFFSRLTHSHPGRVVWLGFNVLIAFLLMELGVFGALDRVLGLYSNIAIAWVGALVADLVVNKPLGLSPSYIEFQRAHLFDINPVGVGAMLIASALAIAAYMDAFGETVQAFSPFVALFTAFLMAPVLALLTRGRFYIARPHFPHERLTGQACCVCEQDFEVQDKTICPVYEGVICSLCCTLDVRCGDACKPQARLREQFGGALEALLPSLLTPTLKTRISHYIMVFFTLAVIVAAVLGLILYQELIQLGPAQIEAEQWLADGFQRLYVALLVLLAIGTWWLILTEESRRAAQDESNKQTGLLLREIDEHQVTDTKLQQAKEAADQANRAKSRFLGAMSHELRGPLNSVLGFAEILLSDQSLAEPHREGVSVIHQSSEHLLGLLDDILDIARIEARKLQLRRLPFRLPALLAQVEHEVQLQSRAKGLLFLCRIDGRLSNTVKGDEKRVRQVLSNLLGNAVKFTQKGQVELRVRCASDVVQFEVRDTGPGIGPDDLEKIFQPFQRVSAATATPTEGAGLGLTVTRMLTDLMGGELTVESELGVGSVFRLRLFLPKAAEKPGEAASEWLGGYAGPRRHLLITDDQNAQRAMLANLLGGLGFSVEQAAGGEACVEIVRQRPPDLILLDRVMPGQDGIATLGRLRGELGFQGPIVMVSANAFATDREEALAAGCNDYLIKPVRLSELTRSLREQLGLVWRQGTSFDDPEALSDADSAPLTVVMPEDDALAGLSHFAQIGYVDGVVNVLEDLHRARPDLAAFCARGLTLAKEYRLRELQEFFTRG